MKIIKSLLGKHLFKLKKLFLSMEELSQLKNHLK